MRWISQCTNHGRYGHRKTLMRIPLVRLPFTSRLYSLAMYNFSAGLDHLGWCKFSPKNTIPEPTCDTKSILVVRKVMLQVISLELTVVGRKAV